MYLYMAWWGVSLISNREHLTVEGLEKSRKIKANMNTGRKIE